MNTEQLDRADSYEAHQAWPAEITRAIAAHLLAGAPASPRTCLFLGAATGVNDVLPFARLADQQDHILAGDIEPAYVARLKKHLAKEGLSQVEARQMDIRTDLAGLGTFDIVTVLFVIHRLTDWQPVVAQLPDLLRPGGSLYVSEFAGPSGLIYYANQEGGHSDLAAQLIRRYFELRPDRFQPPLRSTSMGPVREALAARIPLHGWADFVWPQQVTIGDIHDLIRLRAFAPFHGTDPSGGILAQLQSEFIDVWSEPICLEETIRIFRYVANRE